MLLGRFLLLSLNSSEERGEQKEAFRFLYRLLNRRFGEMDTSIIERIRILSTEQLEVLGEEFLSFSNVSELLVWLENNTSS